MTQRIQRHPFLAIFDGADPSTSTAVRMNSTTPLQALFLLNDPFVHEQSRLAAERIFKHSADTEAHLAFAYELVFCRQPSADEFVSAETFLAMYGLIRGESEGFGWQCLVARRLAERGVRFIELVDGSSSHNWDQHGNMAEHAEHAKVIDQPLAGLLQDLKGRGMLDETLVVWTTEFGRTPGVDGDRGRGHHSACFSSWLAGAGVKGGISYGSTDEIGATVAENGVHVHDFHATILHLLGIDHTRLTYRNAGRDYRLTDVHGRIVHDILA